MNKLVCFVGPSGVGKTSYAKRLIRDYSFSVPKVATTRSQRQDDGSNYIYIDEPSFFKLVNSNELIEWDKYNNYYYGSFKKSVINIINSSEFKGCVLDLTPQGCKQVKAIIPEAIIISLLPDNNDWLRKRLCNRGTDNKQDIEKRMNIIETFMSEVINLNEFIVYCSYEPESWEVTFSQIVSLINL